MTKRDWAEKIRYWVVWVWLCFESGGFVTVQLGLKHSAFFWPFWISLFIAVTLAIELIDRW